MSKLSNPADLTRTVAEVTIAYLAAVAFTEFGGEGQPAEDAEFSTNAILRASEEVAEFMLACHQEGLLVGFFEEHSGTASQFGHDFWMNRNNQGAGFWDRGMGEVGERLSKLSYQYHESSAHRDDEDGLIYFD